MEFRIGSSESLRVADIEIGDLLTRVYVSDGFTSPERAGSLFSPPAVRARGHLICARPPNRETLAGMVMVVTPDSPARRLAESDEAEIHLLAVDHPYRGAGLGRYLIAAAIDLAGSLAFRRLVLWTQPSMNAARRLYESQGFDRAAERDPVLDGMRYLAYTKQL